jgi:hypothetical protein
MNKVALVVYNPEMMCFVHVLLYALDFREKGYEVKIVLEGGAVKLVSAFGGPDAQFASLYEEVKENGLIDCVCKACATKLGSSEEAERQGLRVAGEIMGHPSLEDYIHQGFQIITF